MTVNDETHWQNSNISISLLTLLLTCYWLGEHKDDTDTANYVILPSNSEVKLSPPNLLISAQCIPRMKFVRSSFMKSAILVSISKVFPLLLLFWLRIPQAANEMPPRGFLPRDYRASATRASSLCVWIFNVAEYPILRIFFSSHEQDCHRLSG